MFLDIVMYIQKKSYKTLLKNLKMPLLNFNFVMIFIIHKMLVLFESHLNYLIRSIF